VKQASCRRRDGRSRARRRRDPNQREHGGADILGILGILGGFGGLDGCESCAIAIAKT
jgi:hypothetical protein